MAPGFFNKAKSFFKKVGSGIKNVAGKVWNGVKNVAGKVINTAVGLIGGGGQQEEEEQQVQQPQQQNYNNVQVQPMRFLPEVQNTPQNNT